MSGSRPALSMLSLSLFYGQQCCVDFSYRSACYTSSYLEIIGCMRWLRDSIKKKTLDVRQSHNSWFPVDVREVTDLSNAILSKHTVSGNPIISKFWADLLRICRLVLSDPNKDLNKSGPDRDPPQKMQLDHYKLNNYSAFSPMANHLQRFDICSLCNNH